MIDAQLKVSVYPGQVTRQGTTKNGDPYCIQRVWVEGLMAGPVPVEAFLQGGEPISEGEYTVPFGSCVDLRDGDIGFRLDRTAMVPVARGK